MTFDDSIITDTSAAKLQDMAEVGLTLWPWEYRVRWYGEDEQTAKERAKGLGAGQIDGEPGRVAARHARGL